MCSDHSQTRLLTPAFFSFLRLTANFVLIRSFDYENGAWVLCWESLSLFRLSPMAACKNHWKQSNPFKNGIRLALSYLKLSQNMGLVRLLVCSITLVIVWWIIYQALEIDTLPISLESGAAENSILLSGCCLYDPSMHLLLCLTCHLNTYALF